MSFNHNSVLLSQEEEGPGNLKKIILVININNIMNLYYEPLLILCSLHRVGAGGHR